MAHPLSQIESVATLSWPLAQLGEAIALLGRAGGLAPRPVDVPAPPAQLSGERLSKWIQAAAQWLGLEAEPVETSHAEVLNFALGAGPALVRLPGGEEPRFLALLGQSRRKVDLLGPDLAVHRVPVEAFRSAISRHLEAPLVSGIDRLLVQAGVPPSRQAQARAAILNEQLSSQPMADSWLLRLTQGAPVRSQVRHARLLRQLLKLAGAHLVQYGMWILSWWLIGQGALQGRMDRGWLAAWVLLLLSLVPFRLLVTWWQGSLAIRAGALLKQRLLSGALRLDPEEIRHQGVGQLLGRVIESEAVESLAISGGFLGLFACLELLVAWWVLASGAGGWLHLGLLPGWIALSVLLGLRYWQNRRRWSAARLTMTNDLVERMVGHRTRLAQEARERWHEGEDQAVERYLGLSRAMDRRAAWLMAVVPRGWLLVGLLGFAPGFMAASASPVQLAVGLGGILLAYLALQKLAAGLWYLADTVIAWQQIAPLFRAAARPTTMTSPSLALASQAPSPAAKEQPLLLEAHDLVFRYRDRGEAVLRGCSLRVKSGDRLLLEGGSGSGKSTFASLVTGLRFPDSGLLLLEGLDFQTVGAQRWRQRIVAAPQFHENHVLTGTVAFNLLMGRRWPPRAEDFQEAEKLCRELGLGDLLDRMPAGLLQMVGETGWQLSHGEKSRLYIVRALLQGADLVMLDESFAALDPENLRQALHCVLNRAGTLLVIAHP